ncbi:hypothetical protein DSCOOX_12120 [Desulfosarcina ovata subsp. ovata]|uniref:Uncharacterized protein n=1 Tax=Desulfosarcina ovata subsp. ovata TaxID=2752305 RepID=A0A5K8A609_9BACT|nr:hypothetical protein DSCOOX_12120 [Desulfosarcina ovata subsp. ovata]
MIGRVVNSSQLDLGIGVLEESAKLLALLKTEQVEAFDLDDLKLEFRLVDALNEEGVDQFAIIETVIEGKGLSAVGREICSRALDRLTTKRLITFHAHNRSLVRSVLASSPERMETTDVWDGPREFQRTCLELVTEHGSPSPKVIRAMVQASGFSLVYEVGKGLDTSTVDVVLSELNTLEAEEKYAGTIKTWVNGLQSKSEAIAQWLGGEARSISPLLLIALSEKMTPRWPPLASLHSEVLLGAVEQAAGLQSSAVTATLALVIGLQRGEKSGALIVARTFEEVHQKLIESALPWSAWQWLDSELPRDRWTLILNWDRAGRLRRGLVRAFVEHHDWDAKNLEATLYNPSTRNFVVSLCEQTSKGRRLLDRAGLR